MEESVEVVDNDRAEDRKLFAEALMQGRENIRQHRLPSASCVKAESVQSACEALRFTYAFHDTTIFGSLVNAIDRKYQNREAISQNSLRDFVLLQLHLEVSPSLLYLHGFFEKSVAIAS